MDETTLIEGVDFFPSLTRLAGVAAPEVEFDGEDASGAFFGEPFERDEPMYWEYRHDIRPGDPRDVSPQAAMRDRKWKFLMNPDGTRPELYDLDKDPAESQNLMKEYSERATEMSSQLKDWLQRTSAR